MIICNEETSKLELDTDGAMRAELISSLLNGCSSLVATIERRRINEPPLRRGVTRTVSALMGRRQFPSFDSSPAKHTQLNKL
jgi:hypothetical protein